MSTFILIHGGGDVGWYWHLVESVLRSNGHDVISPDLPADDETFTLDDYADVVISAAGDRDDLVVVGHSFGGFTATLVADRLPARLLVFVTAMVPSPGEPPGDWWRNTGHPEAMREQAERDGGLTGNPDPYVCFYHDVPRGLAEEAVGKERDHPSESAMAQRFPLDALPDVPVKFVLCTEDRFFPAGFMRRMAADRLGIKADEIGAGHCVALSRPRELAALLESYVA
jgi:pimeloyl-ACP methyl ester carboxylesterase